MRVEGAGAMSPGVRVATYVKRSDTERPLSPDTLNELLVLLRSESGFDDSVVTRCSPGTAVGFVLTAKSAAAAEENIELALDFGCNKLILIRPGPDGKVHATNFGALRSAFVALVERALPDDRELRKLS
jgi:hypothetical protein